MQTYLSAGLVPWQYLLSAFDLNKHTKHSDCLFLPRKQLFPPTYIDDQQTQTPNHHRPALPTLTLTRLEEVIHVLLELKDERRQLAIVCHSLFHIRVRE